ARTHDRVVNMAITGRYSHPDCGSEANGTPPNWFGSHVGMWPWARFDPMAQKRGNQKARRSTCWLVSFGESQKPCITTRTEATIRSGPARAGSHRRWPEVGSAECSCPGGALTMATPRARLPPGDPQPGTGRRPLRGLGRLGGLG